MSVGIPVLDAAAHQAEIWIDEVDQAARCDDRHHAYRLLRATLHALRDWVGADQAADLGAQLPVLVRGIYYEGWNPSGTPRHPHGKDDFVAAVQTHFRADPLRNPDLEIGAVFSVLNQHVSPGQLNQMRNGLQKPLRALWPEPAAN
ncbi:DUF2267 domain-containing protein [Devosia sp. A16]|uniref:DUF2267 domain-containing protein n=1 Tax=Devosia sp. A16 TaxID=1736675 RepID=UPI0006D7BD3F|nr:DUF2267 domain-containing protein [Devosia sp. A16]